MSETTTIDFDAAYTVAGFHQGIAFHLYGWAIEDRDEDGEPVYSTDWVRAIMVGDNRVFEVEVCDLTIIDDDDFCDCCGQVGCPW